MKLLSLCKLILLVSSPAFAQSQIVDEPDGKSYNYMSYYEVLIEASPQTAWPIAKNFSAWMTDFELSHVSGKAGEEGEVLRLYPNQDFFIQTLQLIPNKLIVIANLPSTFQNEFSTGYATIGLHEDGNSTRVSLVMNRRYEYAGEGDNPMKSMRASDGFEAQSKAMWQDRFLANLKELAENRGGG